MSDPNQGASVTYASRPEVCDQIGRAVGSLWQRRSGVRPAGVNTEYVGDVIRCTIEHGEAPEVAADADVEAPATDSIDAGGYQFEAQAAVARLTGRTVVGFVAKRVPSGAPATNTFILEAAQVKY